MPKLNLTVSHGITQDEAVKRIKNLLNDVKLQYADNIDDLREEWDGTTCDFKFSAMGFPVSGTLSVKASHVDISGTIPFAAILFKGKIESILKERAEALLV